jgi:hypothetical protein
MLEGVKTVIGENGSVRMTENGKNAAFVGRAVIFHEGVGRAEPIAAAEGVKPCRPRFG